MAESIGRQMAASYTIRITGIRRTRRELALLKKGIQNLVKAGSGGGTYSGGASVSVLSSIGSKDIFSSVMDDLEGRIQIKARNSLKEAMKYGRDLQERFLDAAETPTGRARGGSPGRRVTSTLINALEYNVEEFQVSDTTTLTGWHGWPTIDRSSYFFIQEKGNKDQSVKEGKRRPIVPANSLGSAIPPVREKIKTLLKGGMTK